MSKPYTESELSSQLNAELTWRRRELSDLKTAINRADDIARSVLLRALVAMAYAHWEGFVRTSATKYFSHLTLKKRRYADLDLQFYKNSFLARLESFFRSRASTEEGCRFVALILESQALRFSFVNPQLVDTKSNLSTDVIKDLCLVCGFDSQFFEDNRFFIDVSLLRKRNAIAHGQDEGIGANEVDSYIGTALVLADHFKTLIENKVYTKGYLRAA